MRCKEDIGPIVGICGARFSSRGEAFLELVPPPKKNHGFTLIELLVAITILAIVAVLGWRGLDSIVRSREVLTADLELTRSLQLTFAQLQSDSSQNANPLSYPNIPEGRTSWVEPQRLILIRNEYIDGQAPSMQVVVYRLVNTDLVRFESAPTRDLEELKQALMQASNPPANQVGIVMQRNVQNLEFAGYPDNSTLSNPHAGANSPPNTPPTNPPKPPPDNKNGNKDQKPGEAIVDVDTQKLKQANVTTGVQVSLWLKNHDKKILKIFLLGGA